MRWEKRGEEEEEEEKSREGIRGKGKGIQNQTQVNTTSDKVPHTTHRCHHPSPLLEERLLVGARVLALLRQHLDLCYR